MMKGAKIDHLSHTKDAEVRNLPMKVNFQFPKSVSLV